MDGWLRMWEDGSGVGTVTTYGVKEDMCLPTSEFSKHFPNMVQMEDKLKGNF